MDSDSDVGYNSFVELRSSPDFDAGYLVSIVVVVCLSLILLILGRVRGRREGCHVS